MDIQLKHINFGRDTAETDPNLMDYFVQTLTYERILKGEKSIIVGRKGAGKTALSKYCKETENPSLQYVVNIELSQTRYAKIAENVRSISTQIEDILPSFKLGWLFATLVALLDRLIDQEHIFVSKEDVAVIEFAQKYLSFKKSDPISSFAQYVISWIKNLKTIGPITRSEPSHINSNFFDEKLLLNHITTVIKRINSKGKKVYLFYDKLDENWDGSELYSKFIQGLLLISKDIKSTMVDVSPIILIRDDIFDIVTESFQHVDHFRMDIEHILWDESSLLELLSLRIKHSIESTGERCDTFKAEELFDLIFEDNLLFENKHIKTYTYMIERTLFRPRDIILFSSAAKQLAENKKHRRIMHQDILEAEKYFSKLKFNDLVAQYDYRYSQLRELLSYFKCKNVFYDIEELRFEIISAYDCLSKRLSWLPGHEDKIIGFLFSIGFLSYLEQDDSDRGYRLINTALESDVDILFEQSQILISPIFQSVLRLQ